MHIKRRQEDADNGSRAFAQISHRSNTRYTAVGWRHNEVRIGGRLPSRIAKEESHEGSEKHEHQGYRPETQNDQENRQSPRDQNINDSVANYYDSFPTAVDTAPKL
jgi:hypothetical protein